MPSSFLPGTLRSRSKAGEDRRLRLVTDEVTGPGRSRPRVPLRRHYGRCVLDEHIGPRPMPKGKEYRAQRNGREQKSPAGRGRRAM